MENIFSLFQKIGWIYWEVLHAADEQETIKYIPNDYLQLHIALVSWTLSMNVSSEGHSIEAEETLTKKICRLTSVTNQYCSFIYTLGPVTCPQLEAPLDLLSHNALQNHL
jgi:hypothetical protein